MIKLSLEKEEQERHELRKMIMGEHNEDIRKRDKKKIDDDDSMQFSSTGQPGTVQQNIILQTQKIGKIKIYFYF